MDIIDILLIVIPFAAIAWWFWYAGKTIDSLSSKFEAMEIELNALSDSNYNCGKDVAAIKNDIFLLNKQKDLLTPYADVESMRQAVNNYRTTVEYNKDTLKMCEIELKRLKKCIQ